MLELFLVALAIAIIVYGIWFTYQEGEIFAFVSRLGNKYIPKAIRPSIFQCPVCMVPYYGFFIYWGMYGHISWWTIPVLAIALGINAIIVGFKPKEEETKQQVTPEIAKWMEIHAKEFARFNLKKYALPNSYKQTYNEDLDELYDDYIKSLQNPK